MKKLLKWLFIISVISSVTGYLMYRWQRRAPGPLWDADQAWDPAQQREHLVRDTVDEAVRVVEVDVGQLHAPSTNENTFQFRRLSTRGAAVSTAVS